MQTKPYAQFLQEQRRGTLHKELSESLAEIVAGVQQHGKKGALTLKVTVAPGKVPGTFIVSDKVTADVPIADAEPSLFYADDDGNLSRRDPRQPELTGLRDASADPTTKDERQAL